MGSRSIWHIKKALTTFSSTYFTEVQLLLSKKTIICHGSTGCGTFSRGGGVQLFTGGVQLLFPYRNPYNVIFQGGGGLDPTSLWIHPCDSAHRGLIYLLVFLFFNLSFAHSFVERGENIASAAVLPVVVVVKY